MLSRSVVIELFCCLIVAAVAAYPLIMIAGLKFFYDDKENE